MRDWLQTLLSVILAIAAWCLIFYILGASPSRGAGCLHPVHCTHNGNTSVCDCE